MRIIFLDCPNLPSNNVTLCAIGKQSVAALSPALASNGIQQLIIPCNSSLLPAISDHADINLFHFGGDNFLSAVDIPSLSLNGDVALSEKYPLDVSLNACMLTGHLFCNTKTIHNSILEYALNNNIKIVQTPQGYTKCSIAVIDDASLITEDNTIKKAADDAGFDCLLIEKGHISLHGMNYGFIGGACGKIGKYAIAFTGSLIGHPDRDKIISFIKYRNVEPVFLSDKVCFDCGGITPIMQA